jgi:hypothetical protein
MPPAPSPDSTAPRRAGLALAALASWLLGTHAAADTPDLSWIDRQAVAAGLVAQQTGRGGRPQSVTTKVAIDIAAPPLAIWNVLTACQIAPEYVPNVVSCRRLEMLDDGRAELFVQVVKPAFFVPAFEHVFRMDYTPYTRIDVHRESGPIALMEGTWWLLPQDNGHTLLVYELALDPGMPIPRFFVRATLRRDLPKALQGVRERAEVAR